MKEWTDIIKWLVEKVIDDPAKFYVVLLFLALIFAIYKLGNH